MSCVSVAPRSLMMLLLLLFGSLVFSHSCPSLTDSSSHVLIVSSFSGSHGQFGVVGLLGKCLFGLP